MAIKGKSKSRARKAVTPGPRPTYVPVKKPLLARRGLQFTVLGVVAVVAIAGIWYGVAKERTKQREREMNQKLRTALVQYQSGVDPALAGVGQQLPPSGFSVLPTLKTDVDGLGKGTVTAKTATTDATAIAKQAKDASDALTKIDVTSIVSGKGFDETLVLFLINSKSRMLAALKLYGQVAEMLGMAAQQAGDHRAQLLDRASGVLDVASGLFTDGYDDYVNAQQKGGVFVPTLPTGTGS